MIISDTRNNVSNAEEISSKLSHLDDEGNILYFSVSQLVFVLLVLIYISKCEIDR